MEKELQNLNEINDEVGLQKQYIREPLFGEDIKRIKNEIEILSVKYPIVEKLKNMEIKADDFSYGISTDGLGLFVKPKFLREISNKNLCWNLMYIANIIELGLIILQEEIDESDKMKFNIATCYFVNNIITKYNDPDLEILKGSMLNLEYSDKSIMEIFDLINLNDLKFTE